MNFDTAIFYSDDISKVIPFYVEELGLGLEYQNDDRYVSFMFPNGARLGIKTKDKEREVVGAQTVIIAVESDIEALYERLKSKAPVYKELTRQDWGKNFSVLDPHGNKVEFVER